MRSVFRPMLSCFRREERERELTRALPLPPTSQLSKKLHPDLRPNDAKAKEQYLNISEAYDTLGNDAKRCARLSLTLPLLTQDSLYPPSCLVLTRATYDQTLSPSASLSSFGARTSSAHRPPSSSNTRSGRPSTWQHPSTRLPPRPKHPTSAGPSASWPLHSKKQWENANSGGPRPNFTASPGMMGGGAHFNSPFSPYGSAAPPPGGGSGGAGVDGAPRPSRPIQRTGPAQAPWREDVDINGWDRKTGRILDEGLYAPGSSGKRIFGMSLLILVMIGVGLGAGVSSRNHDEQL